MKVVQAFLNAHLVVFLPRRKSVATVQTGRRDDVLHRVCDDAIRSAIVASKIDRIEAWSKFNRS